MTDFAPRLLIGGPRHGKVLQIPKGIPAWKVSVGEGGRIVAVEYRREYFAVGDAVWEVYIHGDLPPAEDVLGLVTGSRLGPNHFWGAANG